MAHLRVTLRPCFSFFQFLFFLRKIVSSFFLVFLSNISPCWHQYQSFFLGAP